jgi:hypothetical protein
VNELFGGSRALPAQWNSFDLQEQSLGSAPGQGQFTLARLKIRSERDDERYLAGSHGDSAEVEDRSYAVREDGAL